MNFTINRLQHIGIPVADLQCSEEFYKKIGFENVMNAAFEFKGEKGRVIMMQRENIIFEIYQMPEKELAEIRNRKDGHVDHVAFDVDDIDVVYAELKRAGFSIIEEAPVFLSFWNHGCRYFNIIGPDGEKLEFNEILKQI